MTTQRSFLIELEPDADLSGGPVRGRVEHVAWGERGSFGSIAELLDFMSRALGPLDDRSSWSAERQTS